MNSLYGAFAASSPRLRPVRTPVASLVIHGLVLALWLGVVLRACLAGGLFAWSAGLVYAAYDTFLLGFTTWMTWRLVRPRQDGRAPGDAVRGAAVSGGAASRDAAGGDAVSGDAVSGEAVSGEAVSGEAGSLGVIIAAHNEAVGLPGTIERLLAQVGRPEVILVADDGSTDETAAALAPFGLVAPALGGAARSASVPGLIWLRVKRGGKAAALNAALALVDTDVVMTVDADTFAAPGALAAMRAAFAADPGLVAATGVLTPVCAPGFSGSVFGWFQTYEYIRNFLSRFAWMQADGLLLISGAFAGFRRHAVLAVGGFDESCLVEDYELIHRLRRHAGATGQVWRTAVLGDCRATTEAPASIGAFLRQRRRWFGGFLQTQFWYRDMVGNPAYGRLGTWMLPVKAADTLQPLYGLTALAVLIGAAVQGHADVLVPAGGVISGKIAVDLGFHLWSVHLYRRWTGAGARVRFSAAFVAAVLEPFSFQLLRHLGAGWGWLTFLRGRGAWGTQVRAGVAPAAGLVRSYTTP